MRDGLGRHGPAQGVRRFLARAWGCCHARGLCSDRVAWSAFDPDSRFAPAWLHSAAEAECCRASRTIVADLLLLSPGIRENHDVSGLVPDGARRSSLVGTVHLFDHTADVGLRIEGADLDDLFATAAEALFDHIIANRSEIYPCLCESVVLQASSPTEMLVTWLNELIFRLETGHRVYTRFDVQVEDAGFALRAEIQGAPLDPGRHVLDHEVKAVTRHGARVERAEGGWHAELILDI